MCLGGTDPKCRKSTDSEVFDYYRNTAQSSVATSTAPRQSAYALAAASITNVAANPEFIKCGQYLDMQHYQTNPDFGASFARLPAQCQPIYLNYICEIECQVYGSTYLHVWGQINEEDKLRLKTESDYDIFKPREFLLHTGNKFKFNCQGTPSVTFNDAMCDVYQLPPLPDPVDLINSVCGPINLQLATFTAQFSLHTDAPQSEVNEKIAQISSFANKTSTGNDVLTYTSSIAVTGTNSTGVTYLITVSFTGPSQIAENAAEGLQFYTRIIVGTIPGSTVADYKVIDPNSGNFSIQHLPSLAAVLLLAFLALSS
jgi:hypothetical protein